ncbi:MAG: hypothetical protein V3575_03675 [Candidatus Absconditabacteria bacterium]
MKANIQNYDKVLDYLKSNNIRYVRYNYFEYGDIEYNIGDYQFICIEKDKKSFFDLWVSSFVFLA